MPKQVKELQKEYPISAVFLGTSVMTPEILQEFKSHNSWIDRIPREQLDLVPKMVMDVSRLFESEAKKYELPYRDLAEDYTTQMEAAYNELLGTP